MNNIKVFNENIEVGGLQIPADFKYISSNFINSFTSLSYFERVNAVCSLLADTTVSLTDFNALKGVEYPASIMPISENFAVVELFDGENANYLDYVLSGNNSLLKISSIIALILSSYVDLIELNLINHGDKINVAISDTDGLFVLSTYIAMKIGVPINAVIIGSTTLKNDIKNGIFTYNLDATDVADCLYNFFYDYDYFLDSLSAKSILASEFYNEDNGENFTLSFAYFSPYYDSVNLVEIITGKKIANENKACQILYEETAIDMPTTVNKANFLNYNNLKLPITIDNLLKFM